MSQDRWARRCFVWMLCLSLVLSNSAYWGREVFGDERPTNPDIGSNTVELLSYGASGYRFQIIPLSGVPPELVAATTLTPELELFLRQARDQLPPDLQSFLTQSDLEVSDVPTGSAPFGSGVGCPLQSTVQTNWFVSSLLLVRQVVSIPQRATDVRVLVSVDNDIVGVFFNGVPLIEHTQKSDIVAHGECPIPDEFRFDVPKELVQKGPQELNGECPLKDRCFLVSFYVVDRGVESFFDTQILAEMPLDQLNEAEIAQAPQMPVSDIAVDCPSPGQGQQHGEQPITIRFRADATGQAGQIKIKQLAPRTFTMDSSLNGDKLVSMSRTPDKIQFMFEQPSQEDTLSAQGLASLSSVMVHQAAIAPLFNCMLSQQLGTSNLIALQSQQECSTSCTSTADTTSDLCWGSAAATATGGAAWGAQRGIGLGGLLGAAGGGLLGGLVGGVVDTILASRCSTLVTRAATMCVESCGERPREVVCTCDCFLDRGDRKKACGIRVSGVGAECFQKEGLRCTDSSEGEGFFSGFLTDCHQGTDPSCD